MLKNSKTIHFFDNPSTSTSYNFRQQIRVSDYRRLSKSSNTLQGTLQGKSSIARNTLQGKVEGSRRRGKPRTTWTRACEERSGLSLHQASQLAQDRTRWREFGQIVGAHVRPSRHKR